MVQQLVDTTLRVVKPMASGFTIMMVQLLSKNLTDQALELARDAYTLFFEKVKN